MPTAVAAAVHRAPAAEMNDHTRSRDPADASSRDDPRTANPTAIMVRAPSPRGYVPSPSVGGRVEVRVRYAFDGGRCSAVRNPDPTVGRREDPLAGGIRLHPLGLRRRGFLLLRRRADRPGRRRCRWCVLRCRRRQGGKSSLCGAGLHRAGVGRSDGLRVRRWGSGGSIDRCGVGGQGRYHLTWRGCRGRSGRWWGRFRLRSLGIRCLRRGRATSHEQREGQERSLVHRGSHVSTS
jgi:hypothetical protein